MTAFIEVVVLAEIEWPFPGAPPTFPLEGAEVPDPVPIEASS